MEHFWVLLFELMKYGTNTLHVGLYIFDQCSLPTFKKKKKKSFTTSLDPIKPHRVRCKQCVRLWHGEHGWIGPEEPHEGGKTTLHPALAPVLHRDFFSATTSRAFFFTNRLSQASPVKLRFIKPQPCSCRSAGHSGAVFLTQPTQPSPDPRL